MEIAQQYIRLTIEEIMLIRWHSGPHTICDNTYRYDQVLKLYPSVKAIYTADEEAATFLEKVKDAPTFQISVFYNWKKNGVLPKV